MSYRKKDRKYAQELMRLIHENEFCRDIAIWDDEYLPPGEDFNAAIPDCVDAKDRGKFSIALPELVKKLAIEPNDDPRHSFFIGLAYLGGVDVEVDTARAVRLITDAAEAELPEAMKKLISMYRTGLGVERDYYTTGACRFFIFA